MNRALFFDALRGAGSGVFDGSLSRDQVSGIEGILDAMLAVGDGRPKTLAYALATAYHETGRRMLPVREGFASSDEGAVRAVAALARRRGPKSAPAKYGQPAGPLGKCYYGRGHVQLTWRENYARSSADAGVDLEQDPDAMLDPVISARILIRGLVDGRWNGAGHGIAHYLPDDAEDNLRDARRTVNGTDRWDAIARYYQAFRRAIEAAGGWPAECAVEAPAATLAAEAVIAPPRARPARAAAPSGDGLAEWLAECPGDPRVIGAWLARMPQVARAG
jgi:Chitinase class I